MIYTNKKIKFVAILIVIMFFVVLLMFYFYTSNKTRNYKPISREEFNSYAEWKNKCIESNSEFFILSSYWNKAITCSINDDNSDLTLKGEEVFDFNYEDFPKLNEQIIINTKTEAYEKNLAISQDWQLYKDSDFGFEIKFPNSFNHSQYRVKPDSHTNKYSLGEFDLRNASGALCNIVVYIYDGKVYDILRVPPLGMVLNAEEININGQIFTQYNYYIEKPLALPGGGGGRPSPKAMTSLVILMNGKTYEITGVADKGGLMESQMKEIISTFKLTN